MTQPLLRRTKVYAGPKTASRERRPKFVQPEIVFIELGTLRNHLEIVQDETGSQYFHILISLPPRSN